MTKQKLAYTVTSMPMPADSTEAGSLLTALFTTLLIPLLALAVDYMARVNTKIGELTLKAGPDLCLIGLGSSGAVFIEPKVSSAFGAKTSMIELVVVFTIFFLRALCLRIEQKQFFANKEYANLFPGVAAIFVVGAILIYSHWAV
ncbi:MAG: hypothetical protein NVS9B13_24330 [Candidatus Acidiferrum sp.]